MNQTFPGIDKLIEEFEPETRLDIYKEALQQPEYVEFAKEQVATHRADIDKFSQLYGVDPKLLESILVFESTIRGPFFTALDSIGFHIYIGSTAQPTNIGRKWAPLLARDDESLGDSSNAIETTAILLRRLSDRIEEPTVAKIASLYNYMGREATSFYAHTINWIYDSQYYK